MCGFLFTTKLIHDSDCNITLQRRGPDHTNYVSYDRYQMIHNLLDISKQKIIQPIIEDDIVLLYNGEIYEPSGMYKRDTLGIIPHYKDEGVLFVDNISGEFAICILDLKNSKIYLYTDVFGTKPLYYAIDQDISVCSYKTPLKDIGHKKIFRVPESSLVEICTTTNTSKLIRYHYFNLDEHVNNYDKCIESLNKAIDIRIDRDAAIGMSSGYESGYMVQRAVTKSNQIDIFYVDNGLEDTTVMKNRLNYLKQHEYNYNTIEYAQNLNMYNTIESSFITRSVESGDKYKNCVSAMMLSHMLRKIKSKGNNIFITGQGGDELMTDYCAPDEDKRLYMRELNTYFPWNNFYSGLNRRLIDMCDRIGGALGIECRYPFLDRYFVQDFLNLSRELKNIGYKPLLREHLQLPVASYKIGLYH
jgi:asparagine synthase (glutamine-hydrolysing)